MLTRSDIFAEFAERRGIQVDTIVKVTIGADEYLFSHRPMPRGLNSAPIYPILNSCGEIGESLDIFSKRFQVSDVTISLSDLPFYPADGETPIRASRLLSNINGADLDIYFIAGDEIEDIDDCLHVFSGLILTSMSIKGNQVEFSAKDKGKFNDIIVPRRVIEDAYPETPIELRGQRIPLVYGDFSAGTTLLDLYNRVGTGLVRGIAHMDELLSYYAFADHFIYMPQEHNAFCISFGGPTVIPSSGPYFEWTDGVYYARATASLDPPPFYVTFKLASTTPGIYDDAVYTAVNPAKICDNNVYSQSIIKDNLVDDDYSVLEGLALWGLSANAMFSKHLLAGGKLIGYYSYLTALPIGGITDPTKLEDQIREFILYLYYGRENGVDERIELGRQSYGWIGWPPERIQFNSPNPRAFAVTNTGAGLSTDLWGSVPAIGLKVEFWGLYGTPCDGILNNASIIGIGNLYLEMSFTLSSRPDEAWIGCIGRTFGAWIDSGSRSNNYNQNDYIDCPAYIIESLYRDELGLTDDDIDVASFDNAHDNNVVARINITDPATLSEIARRLSEQSTFVVTYSSAGKLRAIRLDEPAPVAIVTIDRSEVIDDTIEIGKTDFIVNSLTLKSRWQGEHNAYADIALYEDAASQSAYRVRAADYEWPNICGDSAAFVAAHYVNPTNGLWSKEHIIIRFKTHGLKYSHLQAGDWVELTADFDDIREPYGGTWENKNLFVIGINRSDSDTELELIEIGIAAASPSPSPEPSPSPGGLDGLWKINDTTPSTSTLLTGYSGMVDDILSVWVLKPWTYKYSVGIDMSEEIAITKLRLYDDGAWGAGLQTCTVYLYTSNDNANWTYRETFSTPSISRVATGGANDPYYIDFEFSESRTARYFKLYAFSGPLKSTSGYALLWSEIVATEVSPSPSPSPSP